MRKSTSFLLAATVCFATAQGSAGDQQQCADQFKAADLANDGVLNSTEIADAMQTMPASLANKDRVARSELMAVCSKNAS